jgi:hypothetical protein
VAIRLGAWLDPDHQLRAPAGSPPLIHALRPPGSDEMHYTGGIGLAFERFQIDFGIDISDLVDTASISPVHPGDELDLDPFGTVCRSTSGRIQPNDPIQPTHLGGAHHDHGVYR